MNHKTSQQSGSRRSHQTADNPRQHGGPRREILAHRKLRREQDRVGGTRQRLLAKNQKNLDRKVDWKSLCTVEGVEMRAVEAQAERQCPVVSSSTKR